MSSLKRARASPIPPTESTSSGEVEGCLRQSAAYEHSPLLSRETSPNSHVASSGSGPPGLLVLIGPVLLAGIMLKSFDLAFLATSHPRIASELNHFKDASWIQLSASICSAICVPMYSYLLKFFGMRRIMFLAYGAFTLGTLLCAISTSFWQLLCSRCALGLGSSGITLLSMIIINDVVGLSYLAIWEGFVTCIDMATGMTAGPLGAWIYRHYTWHTVFYLEFAAGAIALCMLYVSFRVIRSHARYSNTLLLRPGDSKLPRMDIRGWLLLALGATVPLVSVTLGDNILDWTHPAEIFLLIGSLVFPVSFFVFEMNVATTPIINMTPVFKPRFLKVILQVFSEMLILNSIVFIIPQYIRARAFEGPSFEDWALTCVYLGLASGAIFGGYLIKTGHVSVQRIMLANALLLGCVCLLFAMRVIRPEEAQYAPFLVTFGISAGVWQSCFLFATLSNIGKQWWAQTLALYYLVETFGGDLGMTLVAAITRVAAKANLRSSLGESQPIEKIVMDALRDFETIAQLPKDTRALVLDGFENAMHSSFYLPCSMAAGLVVLAAAMNMQAHEVQHDEVSSEHEDHESRSGNSQ